MDPGAFLIVANDAAALAAKYPAIVIAGSFDGTLANDDERIALLDAVGNTADEVRYCDGGRWSGYADGFGSSLELRNPRADNTAPEAWAASDESGKSGWQTITYSGQATQNNGPTQFNELILGLLDAGEVLIDDVSVIEDPGGSNRELIQNMTFETDVSAWRIIGNHSGERAVDATNPGNHVLRLKATGPTEHMHNHAETTLKAGGAYVTINSNLSYRISLRAKWVAGSPSLNSRLYFNRLPRTTRLTTPSLTGTPGATNSVYAANLGPTYGGLAQTPVLPSSAQAVEVSVRAADPDGVASNVLRYSVNEGAWQAVTMIHSGGGLYRATIPPQGAGAVVQFYIQGWDGLGATAYYPMHGSASRALYQVADGRASPDQKRSFRIVMTTTDANILHAATNVMSNAGMPCSVVYDGREIYHDVRVRLRASMRGREFDSRVGFTVDFDPSSKLFRGVQRSVSFDRAYLAFGFTPAPVSAVRETVVWHVMNRAGGSLPSSYNDLAYLITPRANLTGSAVMMLANYDDAFLDSQYDGGSDGTTFKLEIIYYPTTTTGGQEGLKLPDPNNTMDGQIRDIGSDPELYRWYFLIRNQRARDDYSTVTNLCKTFSLSGTDFLNRVGGVIDVDQWLRAMAVPILFGVLDTHATGDPHNTLLQVRSADGKLVYFPWDDDWPYYWGWSSALVPYDSGKSQYYDLYKLVQSPAYERLYYGHVNDIVDTAYNTNYLSAWIDRYNGLTPEDNFGDMAKTSVRDRAAYAKTEIAARFAPQYPFSVTTGGGTVDSETATVDGNGWINVHEIRLEGVDEPLDLTWSSTGSGSSRTFQWHATVPLDVGVNVLTFLAYDFQGNLAGSNTIVITSTVTERPLRDNLRVTELMYNPVDGSDYEFIELCNTGTNTLDISKVVISDGVDFDFANSPITNLAAGAYIVVVGDLVAFSSKYNTNGMNIAGEYTGSLNNGGEHVSIQGQWYSKVLEFTYSDGGSWPLAADGAGHSLIPLITANQTNALLDYWANWRASTYIGGSPGRVDPAPIATNIVINEVMAHTQNEVPPLYSDDWVELFNTTAATFNFGSTNWYLSDSSDNLRKWRIPSSNSIPSRGWTVFTEVNHFHSLVTNGFGLDKLGEELYLSYLPGGGVDRVVDCIRFGGQAADASYGRYSDGQEYWYKMALTPRAANQLLATQEVVISELMYHPAPTAVNPENNQNDEYVEIYNPNSVAMTLMNPGPDDAGVWRLDGEVEYDFPTNTVIPARGYIAVVSFNPTNTAAKNAFLAAYGQTNGQATILGPYSGQLDNQVGEVKVQRPIAPDLPGENWSWYTIDAVEYFDQAPWPTTVDGTGKPLQRRPGRGTGLCPTNWVAGLVPTPGLASAKVAITNPVYNTGYLVPFSAGVDATVDPDALEGAVQKVEFFDGASSLNVDTSAPYGFTLSGMTTPGNHMLYAKLTDDAGVNTSPGVLIVVYTNVPGSDAGKDQTMNMAVVDEVTLDATLAYNGIPTQEVTTSWAMTSGPGTASFGNASSPDTTVSFSTVGAYILRLQTVYGVFVSNDYVTITVVDTNTLNQIPYQESFE